MTYTIQPIETKYRGTIFRSRLEAKWAVMFDNLGWQWSYEPVEFSGWFPDFAIHGENTVWVEVKPVNSFPEDVAEKIDASACAPDECLIVGLDPIQPVKYGPSLRLGWLREVWDFPDAEGVSLWDEAAFGRWECNPKGIGFCHTTGQFLDRITGGYDGGRYGRLELDNRIIMDLWGKAAYAVRYNPQRT